MFEPLHAKHSVSSVIIRATGSGGMMETERPNLQREYAKRWKSVLPAEQVAQQIQVTVGVTAKVAGSDDPQPLVPTLYAHYTPSGVAAWWMEIGAGVVTIGTSQYTRWADVWRKATGLLKHVGEMMGAEHQMGRIRSLDLTYEDLFVFRDDDAGASCTPSQVIREQWIPDKARESREWHTGQGWVDDPTGKRILERFQISGLVVQDNGASCPAIKIETTAIQGFGGHVPILNLTDSFRLLYDVNDSCPTGQDMGDELHQRTNSLLKNLLVPQMSQRIGLTQSQNE